MSRYKCMSFFAGENESEMEECGGQRKKTKSEIEKWILDNGKPRGIDWRCGYTVKFNGSDAVYKWVWIKNNLPVKV